MKWKDIAFEYDRELTALRKEKRKLQQEYFKKLFLEKVMANPETRRLEIIFDIADAEGYTAEYIRKIISHKQKEK